jgi:hypothetical protein
MALPFLTLALDGGEGQFPALAHTEIYFIIYLCVIN